MTRWTIPIPAGHLLNHTSFPTTYNEMKIYHKKSTDQDSPSIIPNNEAIGGSVRTSGILKYKIPTTTCSVEPLYQDNPRVKSTYTQYKNCSLTDSLESYQNGVWKETVLLHRNNRTPTQEFVLHFLKVLTACDIIKYRTRIFRVLVDNGLEAVANIELTKGKDDRPNNTVHIHVLTDDQREENKLRELFETACERQGLVKDHDFRITSRQLYDGYRYFNYFTKCGYSNTVILFRKDIRLQKFYQIGTWFKESKATIWKDYIREKYPRVSVMPIQPTNPFSIYPRPMNETGRTIAAYDKWILSQQDDGVAKLTHVQVAKEYNISSKSVQRCGIVMERGSASIQRTVREGFSRVSKAFFAVRDAEKLTGIVVSDSTSIEDREKAFEMQERIFTGELEYQKWSAEMQKMVADYEKLKGISA